MGATTSTVTTGIDKLPTPKDPNAPVVQGKSALGKDEFLKLLTTQLQYQDPLSPMDNSQFIAQLAQFSQVEQLQGMGSKLDTLTIAQASANQLNASTLVGKQVRFKSDGVTVATDGAKTGFEVTLGAEASTGTAVITDSAGRVVKRIELGAHGAGTFHVDWDGLDNDGKPVPAGSYTVSLSATAADKSRVDASLSVSGTVVGVSYENQAAELVVAGRHVKMSDVIQIDAPKPGN
jgi:flagellar basal-body rod modification protein FlgD